MEQCDWIGMDWILGYGLVPREGSSTDIERGLEVEKDHVLEMSCSC